MEYFESIDLFDFISYNNDQGLGEEASKYIME